MVLGLGTRNNCSPLSSWCVVTLCTMSPTSLAVATRKLRCQQSACSAGTELRLDLEGQPPPCLHLIL